jgi:hypothetical protein
MRNWICHLKISMRAGAAGVNDPFWDSLVIEVGDLLAEGEILQERRASLSRLQRVLIVSDDHALVRRERLFGRGRRLMGRPSCARDQKFVGFFDSFGFSIDGFREEVDRRSFSKRPRGNLVRCLRLRITDCAIRDLQVADRAEAKYLSHTAKFVAEAERTTVPSASGSGI